MLIDVLILYLNGGEKNTTSNQCVLGISLKYLRMIHAHCSTHLRSDSVFRVLVNDNLMFFLSQRKTNTIPKNIKAQVERERCISQFAIVKMNKSILCVFIMVLCGHLVTPAPSPVFGGTFVEFGVSPIYGFPGFNSYGGYGYPGYGYGGYYGHHRRYRYPHFYPPIAVLAGWTAATQHLRYNSMPKVNYWRKKWSLSWENQWKPHFLRIPVKKGRFIYIIWRYICVKKRYHFNKKKHIENQKLGFISINHSWIHLHLSVVRFE